MTKSKKNLTFRKTQIRINIVQKTNEYSFVIRIVTLWRHYLNSFHVLFSGIFLFHRSFDEIKHFIKKGAPYVWTI
jgi:hypothetical protein